MFKIALIAVGAYLLGSIPFGYLLVRTFRGEDVRLSGSGNIGATNVSRKSPALGVATLILDALKGAAAVGLAYFVCRSRVGVNFDPLTYFMMSCAAVFAIVGHMFPVWFRFRGGKGVATSLGAFAPIAPHAILGAIAVFVVALLHSRYVSLGSILASASFPIFAWFWFRSRTENPVMAVVPLAVAALLVIVRHHQNIRRLLAGTENRFGARRAEGGEINEGSK